MSTPTPRTKPIDLSKCKVGQRVKLRNQQEERIIKINASHPYPYSCKNGITWDESGLFQHGKEHPFDIVAILPLPKKAGKKASGMPAEKPLKMTKRERELHNGQINKVIEQLKGLLKP